MTHYTSEQAPLGAAKISARIGGPRTQRVRAKTALAVYDRHGDALFSLALLLCRDVDRAVEAVVSTVTQACATASGAAPDAERQHLAADLWHRYADDPAAPAQQPDRVPPAPAHAFAPAGGSEQALLGLVLFGCHSYGQAAALIGVSPPSAALHLRSVLRRAASAPTGRRSTSPRYPTAKGTT